MRQSRQKKIEEKGSCHIVLNRPPEMIPINKDMVIRDKKYNQ